MAYARIVAGVVREILPPLPEGVTPSNVFPAALAAMCHECPEAVRAGWLFDGTSFTSPPVIAPSRAELLAYAARKRWRVETGGILVGGVAVNTDRASQSMITGAFVFSQQNPSAVVKFKARAGFVDLDAATVAAIATAIGSHVQAAFAIESEVVTAIDAGTITTRSQIEAASWPANAPAEGA